MGVNIKKNIDRSKRDVIVTCIGCGRAMKTSTGRTMHIRCSGESIPIRKTGAYQNLVPQKEVQAKYVPLTVTPAKPIPAWQVKPIMGVTPDDVYNGYHFLLVPAIWLVVLIIKLS